MKYSFWIIVLLPMAVWADLSDVLELDRQQHRHKAMRQYLEWIVTQSVKPVEGPCAREQALYQEAKAFSAEPPQGMTAQQVAKEVVVKYAPEVAENPSYHRLKFILATAYLVLEDGQNLYPTFTESYQAYPEHYYAHKIRGLMWEKLLLASTGEEREDCARHVTRCFQRAVQARAKDTQLYAVIVELSPEKEKKTLALWCLKELLSHDHPVPRRHINFWVDEALKWDETELAQQFVERAHGWYQYSRQLQAAERKLQSRQKKV